MGVTSQCNMNCTFCYSQATRKKDELDVDRWTSYIERNASSICAINYGTGENTLCPSWYRIISYVREHFPHIRQSLTTNGSLAEAIKVDDQATAIDTCIDEIDVSLDFADLKLHDRMRGFSGAYDLALHTLGYCKAYGKRATIVALGYEKTLALANLAPLFELAARFSAFIRINLYRHVNDKSTLYYPSIHTVLKALDWIIRHHTVVSISEPVFKSMVGIDAEGTDTEPLSMRILPNGDITPSTYLITKEWVAGNICNHIPLAELILTAPFRRFHNSALPVECSGCHYVQTCRGGALDRRFLTWGCSEKPDIYCSRGLEDYFRQAGNVKPVFLHQKTVHSDYLPTMIFSPYRRMS